MPVGYSIIVRGVGVLQPPVSFSDSDITLYAKLEVLKPIAIILDYMVGLPYTSKLLSVVDQVLKE